MSSRVKKTPRAEQDLIEQFVYIGADNLDAAERFMDAAEDAFEKLAKMPEMGRRYETSNPKLQGLHKWPIHGFEKHLVFYRPTDDGIEVVRVIHGMRNIPSVLDE